MIRRLGIRQRIIGVYLLIPFILVACVSVESGLYDPSAQLRFYQSRATDKHLIFEQTLGYFSHQKSYLTAIKELSASLNAQGDWLLVQRLSPGTGRFELAAITRKDANGKWAISRKEWHSVDKKLETVTGSFQTSATEVWRDAPAESQESDDLWLFDYSVVYVTVCCRPNGLVRVAIVNPGFKNVEPNLKAGTVQYELSLPAKYLKLSEYVGRVISVVDQQ